MRGIQTNVFIQAIASLWTDTPGLDPGRFIVKIHSILNYFFNAICVVICLSVFTSNSNHLYYTSWTFDASSKYSPLLLNRGPLYYIYFVSILGFFAGSIYIVIREVLRNKTKLNIAYAFYFGGMLLCGLTGYIVFLTDLSKGYDASIIGLLGSVGCLTVLFFKYKIFDVLTLAKDEALETSPTGIIILDEHNKVSYANKKGKELILNGVHIPYLTSISEDATKYKDKDSVYEVTKKIVNVRGSAATTSYEFRDITESSNYQERLEKEVEERAEKIESIQRKVVSSFASVVEARSLETGEHILRTSEYVKLTIEALNKKGIYQDIIDKEYERCLIDVAPLHDVGKISVPDSILLKPGKLTSEEFEKMKIHAEVGAKVIEAAMKDVENDDYVKMAMEVAKYHHERWDGTGYPSRLKGEEIPLCARIMAIADTYDALISKRCYKEAFSKEEAIHIIQEESGSHFDPKIVGAFISAI